MDCYFRCDLWWEHLSSSDPERFSDIDATVITSGQDRFYYAEGKNISSAWEIYFVTPGERKFLLGKNRTLAPTVRILRLQHVDIGNIYKRRAAVQTNAVLTFPFCQNILLLGITEVSQRPCINALSAPVVTLPEVNSYSLILDDSPFSNEEELGMKIVVVAFDANKLHNGSFIVQKNHERTKTMASIYCKLERRKWKNWLMIFPNGEYLNAFMGNSMKIPSKLVFLLIGYEPFSHIHQFLIFFQKYHIFQ